MDWDGSLQGLQRRAHSAPSWFLHYHVFGFLKFFDSTLQDDHEENFYMEREWRVAGDVGFNLEDVRRIILPEAFARRFRAHVPQYYGQLTFSE